MNTITHVIVKIDVIKEENEKFLERFPILDGKLYKVFRTVDRDDLDYDVRIYCETGEAVTISYDHYLDATKIYTEEAKRINKITTDDIDKGGITYI